MKNAISYSAVVLDDKSRTKLIQTFSDVIPEGWEIITHHMTINMGAINPDYEKFLGLKVPLTVNEFAIDDLVCAVSVDGFPSKNNKPHITIAVNRHGGGKPVMSNNLTNWEKVKRPFKVTGKVTEVEFK